MLLNVFGGIKEYRVGLRVCANRCLDICVEYQQLLESETPPRKRNCLADMVGSKNVIIFFR